MPLPHTLAWAAVLLTPPSKATSSPALARLASCAHALGLAGSPPGKALYVGDNYYADVLGAQRAGIRPILVDPQGVFPDAECPVIDSVGEIVGWLGDAS